METVFQTILVILALIISVFVFKLYHSIFDVAYLGCKPFIIELIVIFIISGFIAGIILSPIAKLFGVTFG